MGGFDFLFGWAVWVMIVIGVPALIGGLASEQRASCAWTCGVMGLVVGVAGLVVLGSSLAGIGLAVVLTPLLAIACAFAIVASANRRQVRKSAEEAVSRLDSPEKYGSCPNCEKPIPLDSDECQYCQATFGKGSTWKITPLLPRSRGMRSQL